MVHKHRLFFVIFNISIAVITMLSSCGNGNENPHPDISKVPEQQVEIVRLDQIIASANPGNYKQVFSDLTSKHPEIFDAYYTNFWGLSANDTSANYNLFDTLFVNTAGNKWMMQLQDTISKIYSDLDDVEEELAEAFRYYKYYFPDSSLPKLYTYTGPFVYQTLFNETTLGIELDMYMGQHFGYYGAYESNMPLYITFRFDRPFISLNVMRSLMDGYLPAPTMEMSLLDAMVLEGKMMYYLDCVLPDMEDSIKMGYTEEQIEWCVANEAEIWKFFAGEELLFSKRTDDMRRYMDDAPTSVGMPEEAPGRVAAWTGWQIIRAYMRENPDTDLNDLFNEIDALKILKLSGYGPES